MLKQTLRFMLVLLLLSGIFHSAHAKWVWTPQTGRWINIDNLPKETAELQVEFARTLMLEGDHVKAMRETNKFDKYYSDTDYADDNQYLRGEIRMAEGKYLNAAKEFQTVVDSYPESELFDEVIARQYGIGDAQYDLGQQKLGKKWAFRRRRPFKQAIDSYNMVINNQPFKREAAEAQYKVGLCYFTREEYLESAYEYRRVIEDYATSDWVDEASTGLALCYYKAALSPEYDQTPAQLTISAIDNFTERYPDDDQVADLGEKRSEMRERIAKQRLQIAQFYEKRRNFNAARIYYEIVVQQFSDTKTCEKAQNWLTAYEARNIEAGQ